MISATTRILRCRNKCTEASSALVEAVEFGGLRLGNAVFTASGTCGYADELGEFMDLDSLGGFITKSITALPRKGNAVPRIVETDAGMLNAIGLANIGVERFCEEKLPILAGMKAAVFVNVAGETIEDYVTVVQRLAGEEAIARIRSRRGRLRRLLRGYAGVRC